MGFMSMFQAKKVIEKEIEERYELGKKLGEGNFAEVFVVKDKKNGKEYAMKIIHRKRVKDKEYMVKSELDVMKQLSHPHIISLVDVAETKKSIYVVTEMASGGDLFENVQVAGKLHEDEAKNYCRQILKALEYIHSLNIVHRDIKPENILLSNPKDKNILIIDFGLAVVMKDGRLLRESCGSPEYVAPEVLRPQHIGYGTKADLWSVGVVTYIMLCGYHPFSAENEENRSYLIRNGIFEFHEERWSFVSEQAKDFVKKLIEIDVSLRLDAKTALSHPWLSLSPEKEAEENFHEELERRQREQERLEREEREKQREELRKALSAQPGGSVPSVQSFQSLNDDDEASLPSARQSMAFEQEEVVNLTDQLDELDALEQQSKMMSLDASGNEKELELEIEMKRKLEEEEKEKRRKEKEEEVKRMEEQYALYKLAQEKEETEVREKEEKRRQIVEEKKLAEIDAAFSQLDDTLKDL